MDNLQQVFGVNGASGKPLHLCPDCSAYIIAAGSADTSQSGYFTVRGMLAKSVTEAARFIAERGVIEEGAPILVRFITLVASRFGVVVTHKVAAQALPVIGALGGAAVNYAFIKHFQDVARGHFTVRRLERVYGKSLVRTEYERLAQDH
jgi:EcsC protein family